MNDTNLNSNLGNSSNWSGASAPIPSPGAPIQKDGVAPLNIPEDVAVINETEVDVLIEAKKINTHLDVSNKSTETALYTSPINQPSLQQATINDPTLAAKTLNLINNPSPQMWEQSVQNLASLLPTTPTPEEYAEAAKVTVTDPAIIALAAQTGVPAGIIFKNVQAEKNSDFAEQIKNLPQDVKDKLTFAFHVPNEAKNLPPELQKQLADINAQVNQNVAKNFGFSSDWQGIATDSTEFLSTLSAEFDTTFEKLLQAKLEEGSLSASDAATLKAMHNGLATGTPTLQNLLKNLEGQATSQLQAKFGFDVSYQPKGDTAFYNNVVNGDFAQTYQKNVAKYTGTATAEQKALLAQYAANPNDPSIPASIKQLATQIANEKKLLLQAFPDADNAGLPENLKTIAKGLIATTTNAIIGKYGLDSSWNPTIKALILPGVDEAAIKNGNNAIAMAQEVLSLAGTTGAKMSEGPEKAQFLAFLKMIGAALIALQETIYAMQGAQTASSKALNRGKLDMQLNAIAKQQEAADKARKKSKKMAGMGALSKVFDWATKIVLLALGTAIPALFVFSLAYFTDSAVSEATGKNGTYTQEMFREITEHMPPGAAAAVNFTLAAAISMLVSNPLLTINLMTQDCRFMQSTVKACGGNEQEQEIAGMVLYMAVQIAIMVASMIVTGGATSKVLIAKTIDMIQKATNVAAETAKSIAKVLVKIPYIISISINIASSGIKLNNNVLLAQMTMIKARAEKYNEEVQGMIAALKKVIEKLLELLQGGSDSLVSINNFQGKKWEDASQISSELAG